MKQPSVNSDSIRTLELRAANSGVRTYYKIPSDTSSDAFRDASDRYEFADRILKLPDDSPEFLNILEKTGLNAQQYRYALQNQLQEAMQRMEELSAPAYVPTPEFLSFAASEYIRASSQAESYSHQITELRASVKKLWIILALCLIYAVIISYIAFSGSSSEAANDTSSPVTSSVSANTSSVPTQPADPDAGLTKQEYPESGTPMYSYCDPSERVAPLTVKTSGNDAYYVKLVSLDNPTYYLTFFIRPGDTVEYLAPLGDFELRYASGTTWYGAEDLFGSNTAYTKSENVFSFTFDGTYYNGYTVTLYPVENGNMQTEEIDASEF